MRFFASISYNGSGFSGWQIQKNAASIQDEVQKALSTVLGEKISVVGAGRTDTGVNASYYTLHFDTDECRLLNPSERDAYIYKINAILPGNIVFTSINRVRDSAHARFDAVSRTYRYFLHNRKDPFSGQHSWYCKFPLDIGAMNSAAGYLIGKKDFSCFEKAGSSSSSPICDVKSAVWTGYSPFPSYSQEPGYLVFTITANRFLRNMVRAIVGTLIEIGRGKQSPEWIHELLASGDRCMAGQSVPGNALFLTDIKYPEKIFEINEQ